MTDRNPSCDGADADANAETAPDFVAVSGLPGVGKTTVAKAVADRLDATLLRSDVVRKELVAEPAYSDAETERVYAELFRRARACVADGEGVVLDATFRHTSLRERARGVATEADAAFTMVKVECDRATARERIRSRTGDESDADVAVYRTLRKEYDEMTGAHVVVDNSGSVAKTHERVAELF